MVLKLPGAWRFAPPADGRHRYQSVPGLAVEAFYELISRIATQGDRNGRLLYTEFRRSWAETDLPSFMRRAANTPLFLDAFYDGCRTLAPQHPEYVTPSVETINELLGEHGLGYFIREDELLLGETAAPLVEVAPGSATLERRALDLLQRSLNRSSEELTETNLQIPR